MFQDFLVATSKTFQGEGAMILHYPHLNTIIVSTDSLIQLAVKGFNTEAFGFMDFPLFDTVEEALAYARSIIQEKTSRG